MTHRISPEHLELLKQGYIMRYCKTCGKDTFWRPVKWQDNWLRKRRGYVCEGCGDKYQPRDWRKCIA